MRSLMTLCFLLLTASCAGYRFQEKTNPFAQYGVKSISVPMFYNHSNFANISAPVTREIYHMLSTFSGLELRAGDQKADAVLVGIIYSPEKMRDSRRSNSLRSAKSALDGVIGDERGDFYIPATTQLTAGLRLVLIKNPGEKELELLKTSLGKFAVGPRIIVNETIGLSGGFTRELYGANAVDVIDSQNRSALNSAVEDMAEAAARNFKDMILYAF